MKIQAEIVNGQCPTCNEITMLVGLSNELFRCMNCGTDLHQHVNGFQEHENFDGKEELNEILNTFLRIHFKQEIEHGWLNVLNKNGDNAPHQHLGDNVINSGVLYLSNNNSAITFMRDTQIFSFYPKLFNLLIFPKELIHQVSPHLTDEVRISYGINLRNIRKLCN